MLGSYDSKTWRDTEDVETMIWSGHIQQKTRRHGWYQGRKFVDMDGIKAENS